MLPEKTAVVYNDRELTYRQLNNAANCLANHFLKLGIKKGDRIAILIPNSLEVVIIWHATQKMGATAVPINSRLRSEEISHILNDAACKVLIYDVRFKALAEDALADAVSIEKLICKNGEETGRGFALEALICYEECSEPNTEILAEDESVILYTSGTTGRSKGVVHTQQMVKEFIYSTALASWPPYSAPVCLVQSPMFHLGGLQHIWRMAFTGGTLVLVNKIIPEQILNLIERYRATELYLLPPILIKRFHDFPRWREYDCSSIMTVLCTGGKCSGDIARMIFEIFPNSRLRLSYGSTETCGLTLAYLSQETLRERTDLYTTVGKILPGVEMRIVDQNMHDLTDGTPGEALVRSPMLLREYINLPEKNKEAFAEDGWFRTGDMLYRTQEGYYFLVDRIKDMIKSGGENVFAQEVESILRDLPGIYDCAVIGIPDPEMGEGVAAAIVTEDGQPLDAEVFLEQCREKMASYRKPRFWMFLDELPTNSIGKVQKSVLREHPEWFERIK